MTALSGTLWVAPGTGATYRDLAVAYQQLRGYIKPRLNDLANTRGDEHSQLALTDRPLREYDLQRIDAL
jgi:hypothetical protein